MTDSLTVGAAARLQTSDKAEAQLLTAALTAACVRGELPAEAVEIPAAQRRQVGYIGPTPPDARMRPPTPARTVKTYRVGAEALAGWLQARGLEPSARVRAWLATQPASRKPAPPGEVLKQRQDARLARLRGLGGDYMQHGSDWRTVGRRGALKDLCEEERAAGRQPFDQKGVRADLRAAAERERADRREGPAAAGWLSPLRP